MYENSSDGNEQPCDTSSNPVNPPPGLLRSAYQKINMQKRAKKEMKLNQSEKLDLFLKHLDTFATPEVCYNLQGGSHRKCKCLHVLRDVTIRTAVAKWCVQFSEMKETEQNQIILDWVRYSRLANPTKNKKMKTFLIPYHADEVNNEALEPLQHAICTSAIMAICGIGDGRWSAIIGQSMKSATTKPHGNASNNNAKIPHDNPVVRNLTDHFAKVETMAEVIATRFVRELSGEVTLRFI